MCGIGRGGKAEGSLRFAIAGAVMMQIRRDIGPQYVFHINFHKSCRSWETGIYLGRRLEMSPLSRG